MRFRLSSLFFLSHCNPQALQYSFLPRGPFLHIGVLSVLQEAHLCFGRVESKQEENGDLLL